MAEESPYAARRFKRGLVYFGSGKVASALLGLMNFTLIVRSLAIPEYAAYVSIIAALELAIAFSTFGLDWAGARYLPELRERGDALALRRLITRLCLYRVASLLATAALGALLLAELLRQAHVEQFRQIAQIYLYVLCAEGMLRFILGVIFDPLLLQAQSQVSLLVRNAVFAASLALADGAVDLGRVAHFDLLASIAGLLIALTLLAVHLRSLGTPRGTRDGGTLPTGAQMRHMALHNYASLVLNQPYSPQALLLVAGLFLPASTTAMLGFARNLAELIRRYQPVEMLLGLLRPMMISVYAQGHDFARLERLSSLIYKLSLISLCPILVVFAAYGDVLIGLVSTGKYPDAYWLVVGLACTLILRSHRLLIGTIANILDQPQLLTRTALASLVILPLCMAGFSLGQGALTLVGAACVEEILGTWIVMRGVRALGLAYVAPWSAMLRVVVISLVLSGLLLWARRWGLPTNWLLLQIALIGGAAISLALASGFFDRPERMALRGFVAAGVR